MNTHIEKSPDTKSNLFGEEVSKPLGAGESAVPFEDNRPEAIAQRKRQDMANNSPQVKQLQTLQTNIDNSPRVQQNQGVIQRVKLSGQDAANEAATKRNGLSYNWIASADVPQARAEWTSIGSATGDDHLYNYKVMPSDSGGGKGAPNSIDIKKQDIQSGQSNEKYHIPEFTNLTEFFEWLVKSVGIKDKIKEYKNLQRVNLARQSQEGFDRLNGLKELNLSLLTDSPYYKANQLDFENNFAMDLRKLRDETAKADENRISFQNSPELKLATEKHNQKTYLTRCETDLRGLAQISYTYYSKNEFVKEKISKALTYAKEHESMLSPVGNSALKALIKKHKEFQNEDKLQSIIAEMELLASTIPNIETEDEWVQSNTKNKKYAGYFRKNNKSWSKNRRKRFRELNQRIAPALKTKNEDLKRKRKQDPTDENSPVKKPKISKNETENSRKRKREAADDLGPDNKFKGSNEKSIESKDEEKIEDRQSHTTTDSEKMQEE